MALIDLPTLDGNSMQVEAKSVFRITRQYHPVGAPDFTRVDMPADSQLCRGSAAELATLVRGGDAKLIQVTAPDGSEIFLNVAAITDVRPSDPANDPAEAKSVIIVGGKMQAVRETTPVIDAAMATA
jgi:hypothetical protein